MHSNSLNAIPRFRNLVICKYINTFIFELLLYIKIHEEKCSPNNFLFYLAMSSAHSVIIQTFYVSAHISFNKCCDFCSRFRNPCIRPPPLPQPSKFAAYNFSITPSVRWPSQERRFCVTQRQSEAQLVGLLRVEKRQHFSTIPKLLFKNGARGRPSVPVSTSFPHFSAIKSDN